MQPNGSSIPPRPPGKTPWALIIGLCVLGLTAFGGFMLIVVIATFNGPMASGEVAVVYLRGAISDGSEISLLGGSPGVESLLRRLERLRKDTGVKAVVVRVNSPGGTVAASQDLHDALQRLRRSGKKVVASMGDVAASGGYYVAAASDRIVAQRGTLTGSIGVIMGGVEFAGLMKMLGVRDQTIKSGKRKDIGSQFRPMTEDERMTLQRTSDEIHEQFIRDVALGRKMPVARVRKLADGSIYTGARAKELGLIDQVGGLHDAIREAAKLAGIVGEPSVVRYGGGGLFDLFGGGAESFADGVRRRLAPPLIRALVAPGTPLPAVRAW